MAGFPGEDLAAAEAAAGDMRRYFFIITLAIFLVLTVIGIIAMRNILTNNDKIRAPECEPTAILSIQVGDDEIRAQITKSRYYIIDRESRSVSLHGPDIAPIPVPDGQLISTDDQSVTDTLQLTAWSGDKATFHLEHQIEGPVEEGDKSFSCDFEVKGSWPR